MIPPSPQLEPLKQREAEIKARLSEIDAEENAMRRLYEERFPHFSGIKAHCFDGPMERRPFCSFEKKGASIAPAFKMLS